MENENANQFLGTEHIGRLMQKYAVPCIISLLVGALYNIVDQIFIANASYLGSYGNAANTVVFPLTVVALAVAVMIGDGCCAFVSMSLGENEPDRAKCSVGNAVALILAEALPFELIAVFGAKNESSYYTDFAVRAFRIYLCMVIPACVNKACFIFLQAVGKAFSSILLSMLREVVFGVGFAILLPVFFVLDGVLYSMPVSDILTFIISAVIIVKTCRELGGKGGRAVELLKTGR